MDETEEEMPSDEAYGRATNPERYLVLHGAALAEIDRLVTTFDVARIDGVDPGPHTARGWPGSHAVRLTPASGGAPITVTFTSLPGVVVHAGHGFDRAFPRCGCDACDEPPAELVELLSEVFADVASGGLVETRRRRRFGPDRCTIRLESADRAGSPQREGAFDPTEHGAVPVGTTRWPPWRRRG